MLPHTFIVRNCPTLDVLISICISFSCSGASATDRKRCVAFITLGQITKSHSKSRHFGLDMYEVAYSRSHTIESSHTQYCQLTHPWSQPFLAPNTLVSIYLNPNICSQLMTFCYICRVFQCSATAWQDADDTDALLRPWIFGLLAFQFSSRCKHCYEETKEHFCEWLSTLAYRC